MADSYMTEIVTGFLAGTLIDTPFGPVAVETLCPGDLVTVVEDGRHLFRPVCRIERGRLDTACVTKPAAAFPVRIRRHAFADDVPSRDLLAMSDARLHVGGRLVPASMLVNGLSITVDAAITGYDAVHLALDRHAILLAEGLEAETGHESVGGTGSSGSGDAVDGAFSAHRTDAAMPPYVDWTVVEPIRQALADRARALEADGFAHDDLAADSELCLQTADGTIIAPALRDGAFRAFVVPTGANDLRLVSHACRDRDPVGPVLDDHAGFGVCIGLVAYDDGRVSIAALGETAPASLYPDRDDSRSFVGRGGTGAAPVVCPPMRRVA